MVKKFWVAIMLIASVPIIQSLRQNAAVAVLVGSRSFIFVPPCRRPMSHWRAERHKILVIARPERCDSKFLTSERLEAGDGYGCVSTIRANDLAR